MVSVLWCIVVAYVLLGFVVASISAKLPDTCDFRVDTASDFVTCGLLCPFGVLLLVWFILGLWVKFLKGR